MAADGESDEGSMAPPVMQAHLSFSLASQHNTMVRSNMRYATIQAGC